MADWCVVLRFVVAGSFVLVLCGGWCSGIVFEVALPMEKCALAAHAQLTQGRAGAATYNGERSFFVRRSCFVREARFLLVCRILS